MPKLKGCHGSAPGGRKELRGKHSKLSALEVRCGTRMLAPVFTAHRGLFMAQFTVRLLGVGLLVGLLNACSPGPSITLLNGAPRALDAYGGQWLYVNYWAEWCAPCLEEIPELNAFHRADNGAEVLGINFDQVDSARMAVQAEALQIAFPPRAGRSGGPAGDTGSGGAAKHLRV